MKRKHSVCVYSDERKSNPTEHLATDLLAPRLLVIHDAVGSGHHDHTELLERERSSEVISQRTNGRHVY